MSICMKQKLIFIFISMQLKISYYWGSNINPYSFYKCIYELKKLLSTIAYTISAFFLNIKKNGHCAKKSKTRIDFFLQ